MALRVKKIEAGVYRGGKFYKSRKNPKGAGPIFRRNYEEPLTWHIKENEITGKYYLSSQVGGMPDEPFGPDFDSIKEAKQWAKREYPSIRWRRSKRGHWSARRNPYSARARKKPNCRRPPRKAPNKKRKNVMTWGRKNPSARVKKIDGAWYMVWRSRGGSGSAKASSKREAQAMAKAYRAMHRSAKNRRRRK